MPTVLFAPCLSFHSQQGNIPLKKTRPMWAFFPPRECLYFLSPFHVLGNEKRGESSRWFNVTCAVWSIAVTWAQRAPSPPRARRPAPGRPRKRCLAPGRRTVAQTFRRHAVSFPGNNCLSFRFQCFPFVFTITEGCFITFHQAGCHGDQQLLYAVKITLLP